MDVHAFINCLKEDTKNNKLLENIKQSIVKGKETTSSELVLDTPPPPSDPRLKLRAKCLHGNIFEDSVLRTTLDNCNRVLSVTGSNHEEAKKKASKNLKDFQEIFGKRPSTNYNRAMEVAGSKALSILKTKSKGSSKSNGKTTFAYEEWVPNSVSGVLMKSLRADCVTRAGNYTSVVDLKFSTMSQVSYEKEYLIDGITQVLIYAALMGLDPGNCATGVLVYYGKEGKVVFYSSDKYKDVSCMEQLYRKAGIPLKLLRERPAKDTRNQVMTIPPKKNCAITRQVPQLQGTKNSMAEFSDSELDSLHDGNPSKLRFMTVQREGQHIHLTVSVRFLEGCFCVLCFFLAILGVWQTQI